MTTMAFDGRVALVIGAGGGIGLATAEPFARAGASVILADHNEAAIDKAAEGPRGVGHIAIGVHCDATDTARVQAVIERCAQRYHALTRTQACDA